MFTVSNLLNSDYKIPVSKKKSYDGLNDPHIHLLPPLSFKSVLLKNSKNVKILSNTHGDVFVKGQSEAVNRNKGSFQSWFLNNDFTLRH